MNRNRALQLLAAGVAVACLGLVFLWLNRGPAPEATDTGGGETVTNLTGQAPLYFPAISGMLEVEMRATPGDLAPKSRKQWLAEQLVVGPTLEGLRPALPAETRVTSVFAAPDGTVFVDFAIPESVGMSSTEETLTLYSIVNTMLINDEEARRVVILINGRQRETLAWHLDTASPLAAKPELIREAG